MQASFSYLKDSQPYQLSQIEAEKVSFVRDKDAKLFMKATLGNTFSYLPLDQYILNKIDDWKDSEFGVQREGVIFEEHDKMVTIRDKRECVAVQIQDFVKVSISDILVCTDKKTGERHVLVLTPSDVKGYIQLLVFPKKSK